MRFSIKILFFTSMLLPMSAFSAPKNIAHFLNDSKALRLESAKEKSAEKKAFLFKKLEKDLQLTIKEYEKANPEEGGDAEDLVARFSFKLEHVSPLASGKKPSSKDCEKAKHQIDLEDKSGRGENATLSPGAQEALEWASVLCSK